MQFKASFCFPSPSSSFSGLNSKWKSLFLPVLEGLLVFKPQSSDFSLVKT